MYFTKRFRVYLTTEVGVAVRMKNLVCAVGTSETCTGNHDETGTVREITMRRRNRGTPLFCPRARVASSTQPPILIL